MQRQGLQRCFKSEWRGFRCTSRAKEEGGGLGGCVNVGDAIVDERQWCAGCLTDAWVVRFGFLRSRFVFGSTRLNRYSSLPGSITGAFFTPHSHVVVSWESQNYHYSIMVWIGSVPLTGNGTGIMPLVCLCRFASRDLNRK